MKNFLKSPFSSLAASRGAALLSALILLGLVSTLTVGISWVGYSAILRVENQRDYGQAAYLGQAMLDYGRWVLRADALGLDGASNQFDHPFEPWARKIPKTRLTSLTAGPLADSDMEKADQAFVAGQLSDEQGRFNLEELAFSGGDAQKLRTQLKHLLDLLALSDSEAESVVQAIEAYLSNTFVGDGGVRRLRRDPAKTAWWGLHHELLSSLPISEGQRAALGARLTILPRQVPVNLNTVDALTLEALFGDGHGEATRKLVAIRDRFPLRGNTELFSVLPPDLKTNDGRFDTKSVYFRATVNVQFRRAERGFVALMQRDINRVRILDLFEL